MLKKTIKFTDFDGVEQSKDYYFNLTKAELVQMDMAARDGRGSTLAGRIEALIESKNGKEIMKQFKEIIGMSYGERTEDGSSFVKSPERLERFEGTPAYSELFMELVTDADAGSAFITGIVPSDLAEEIQKQSGNQLKNASLTALSNAEAEEKTAAQTARERSEAQLQGHKKKADHEGSDIQDVPTVSSTKPVEEMTRDELIQHLQNTGK